MNVSFSTIAEGNAIDYLSHPCFSYLNQKQKDYVLENLGDIRVQDPMMYTSPSLEMTDPKHYEAIMGLVS